MVVYYIVIVPCDSLLTEREPGYCRGYVGIHSSGFRDFLLKPELLRAIVDCGFEHPSEGMFITQVSMCIVDRWWTCLWVVG